MEDFNLGNRNQRRERKENNVASGDDLDLLDDTSDTNISDILFPSHISGLESFSEFDQTLQSTLNEANFSRQADQGAQISASSLNGIAKDYGGELITKDDDRSNISLMGFERVSSTSLSTDPLDLSLGISDIKSPSSGSEQLVEKFLKQSLSPSDLALTVIPKRTSQPKDALSDKQSAMEPSKPGDSLKDMLLQGDAKDLPIADAFESTAFESGIGSVAFESGIESQQRPGLDGSSSDSDDGAMMNFARSRIGTTYQTQTPIADQDRRESRPPEGRQLAEGDDVFSRDAPGVGGGDGSSGHSDSDTDGDGGVAIRVRNRRVQSRANRTASGFPRNLEDNTDRALPERERPVGDSVPVTNQQWRSQLLGNRSTNQNDDSAVGLRPNSSESLALGDLDSSHDSRLSARFFITSSTPGQAIRHPSTQQSNWMDDNSMFRFSESAPATPRRVENENEVQIRRSNSLNVPYSESPRRRDVLGDDMDQDTTLVDNASGISQSEDAAKSENHQTRPFTQELSCTKNSEANNISSTNPFRFPPASTNPFEAETLCKNPFDDMMDATANGAQAFIFSGCGEQIDAGIDDSDFKLNSQDANALFDEDEKSFQHSNTISKLANLTEGSEWNFDDAYERETRLSKYFKAFSEELGSFNLDREDRPRPIFDDYKAVKTPPALEHPAVLYKEAWRSVDPFTDSSKVRLDLLDSPPNNDTLVQSDAGEKPTLDLDSTDRSVPADFNTQTEADRDNYGIRGNGNRIDLPTTNGEAESLLHDIEVGRVSLRGISGVNVSNLAAKIAVATNSDPKFILKLLITLINAEKSQESRSKTDQQGKEAEATKPQLQKSSEEKKLQRITETVAKPGNGFCPSSTYNVPNPSDSVHKVFEGAASSTAIKLSDLYSDETPVKGVIPVESTAASNYNTIPKQTVTHDFESLSTRSNGNVVNVMKSGLKSDAVGSQLYTQAITLNKPSTLSSSVATVRPVSSVTPLIASSQAAKPPHGESAQIRNGTSSQQTSSHTSVVTTVCGDANQRVAATVNWTDASLATHHGSTISASTSGKSQRQEVASPMPHSIAALNETEPRVYESPGNFEKPLNYHRNAKHLSSTAIFGDESEEGGDPTKDIIHLSPVAASDSPFYDDGDEGDKNDAWRPLRQSQAAREKSQVALEKLQDQVKPMQQATADSVCNDVSSGKETSTDLHEDNTLKAALRMSGEKIQDILPRFSDIRVRDSVATFYPVMTANQTIMQQGTCPAETKSGGKSVWNEAKKTEEQSLYTAHALTKKHSGVSQLRIVVPSEVVFPDVQCVGVAVNHCLPVHNPSSRWIQCLIEVAFYSVNGLQVDSSEVCSFNIQPKIFIAPHTTEDVKITFYAEHAGVFMAKLNVIASAVVSDDSNLSEDDLFPNVVHLEAVAELPNVEILQEDGEIVDFGVMQGGLTRTKSLKLVNKGRANVPLKLVLSANVSIWKYIVFVDSEMAPISSSNKFQDSVKDMLPPAINIEIPGQPQLGKTSPPTTVFMQFTAPVAPEPVSETKLGPPQEFTARVDVEVDSKGSSITIGSVLLKALVGIVRLHAPRSLQALSLSTAEGQRVSRGIPFRNAGNISLSIELQISTFTDLFSVIPDKVFLLPGESAEVFVHFQSPSSITVESFLLVSVGLDGPQYEVVLRGTATQQKQLQQVVEEKPILLCNKPVLCWAGIPIGRSMQQRAYLRNNSPHNDLRMVISVEGNHSDFQIQNTFDFQEKQQNSFEINLKPQSDVPVHVLFVPSTFGMITSALVIRPHGGGTKFRIPLHGYGGCSKLSLTNAQRIGENYWLDAGETSQGRQNIIKINAQNIGNRSAFVKIVCYSDVGKRQLYPSSHISVAPNDFVLAEKCTKQLIVVLQPTDAVLRNSKDNPCTAAFLAVFSGDECIRQLYRKSNSKSTEHRITKEGPLQNMVFDATFMDDDKVTLDVDYPLVPNWENFFVSSVSRTVVSLVARPLADSAITSDLSLSEAGNKKPPALVPQDLAITQTPARRLPPMEASQGTIKKPERKEMWTVNPEHIVLTAPNAVTDKSARIQMVNYSDKPLSFEFSWPAQSLIITPSKDSVPPRSQLIVFVSTKPSFLTTGGELPWRGNIYVQCEGIQKSVRVQIREDLALDSSPVSSLNRQLTRLDPSTNPDTPYQEKPPSKPKPMISVQPQSVIFPATINRFKESAIRVNNNGSASLKWVLSSIAPPYFKDATESGDIFRTTYTAFRFIKYSGYLKPNESCNVQVTFQPRDHGEYSQFWDLQATVDATGDSSKSRIELRGTGVFQEKEPSQTEAKVIGRAQPILKPADVAENEPERGVRGSEKDAGQSQTTGKTSEKRNRGIFLKDETLNFKPTLKGETAEMQFRLCNDTLELQKVRLSGLKLPFSIKHNKLAIKSKSFIRIPVFYSPTEPGSKSEGHLEVTTVAGQAKILYVKLIGACASKR
eukprot:gene19054-20968_t